MFWNYEGVGIGFFMAMLFGVIFMYEGEKRSGTYGMREI
jgi:hypothetical protein